jgi:hypothetical protein
MGDNAMGYEPDDGVWGGDGDDDDDDDGYAHPSLGIADYMDEMSGPLADQSDVMRERMRRDINVCFVHFLFFFSSSYFSLLISLLLASSYSSSSSSSFFLDFIVID